MIVIPGGCLVNILIAGRICLYCDNVQGDHSPGKPGKVREFQSGQGKWEKSGEVKSAEIWLFVQLKYQYHKTHLLYFVSSRCHLVCHFAAVTTPTVK